MVLCALTALWAVPAKSAGRPQQDADSIAAMDSVAMDSIAIDSMAQTDSLKADSVPLRAYTILPDTTAQDSVAADTVKRSSSALDMPVTYSAQDSITFDYANMRATLFGDSKVNYQNLELTADRIDMSIDSSLVHAMGTPDSTGAVKGKPVFKQGEDQYEPDKISYNFKTGKAFISNVYTEQGEGFMQSIDGKRDSTGVLYVEKAKYTTCNAKHPHFYLALTRAKVRPGEDVVFGPANLYVEDVPLPLAIPYGFFPFTSSYSSGVIMPTYGDESTRGFYLRDGGYYFAISDKMDATVLGEIYTKGSWGLSLQSNYVKRYRFNGNFLFSYQVTKEGEKNMPDYNVSKSFKLTWSHRQDSKANPSQSFSASVNFATSSYERNNLTSMYNPESLTQSTRTSSVSYSKTFNDIGLTLSGTFNLSQNMRDSSIALTLPTLNISLNKFYPLKRKKMAGKERWYEKISVGYTGTLTNSINTKESLLLKSSLIKDWKNGMRHQRDAQFLVYRPHLHQQGDAILEHRGQCPAARHALRLLQRVQLQPLAERQHQAVRLLHPPSVVWRQEDTDHPSRHHAHRGIQLCPRLRPVPLRFLGLLREDRCQRQCLHRGVFALQQRCLRHGTPGQDRKHQHGPEQQRGDEGAVGQGQHGLPQDKPYR